MDVLLEYGTPGLVAYCLFLLGRAVAPLAGAYLPHWVSARDRREDRVLVALENCTRVMAESVATLQSFRVDLDHVRSEASELRLDVQFIAQQIEPAGSRRRRASVPEAGSGTRRG